MKSPVYDVTQAPLNSSSLATYVFGIWTTVLEFLYVTLDPFITKSSKLEIQVAFKVISWSKSNTNPDSISWLPNIQQSNKYPPFLGVGNSTSSPTATVNTFFSNLTPPLTSNVISYVTVLSHLANNSTLPLISLVICVIASPVKSLFKYQPENLSFNGFCNSNSSPAKYDTFAGALNLGNVLNISPYKFSYPIASSTIYR